MMTTAREKKYHEALVSIAQVLGTGLCKTNKCEGCQYEMRDAAVTARKAIGWKINGPKTHKSNKKRVNKDGKRVKPSPKKICPCHPPEGVARTCSLHVYLCADESCDCNCDADERAT